MFVIALFVDCYLSLFDLGEEYIGLLLFGIVCSIPCP